MTLQWQSSVDLAAPKVQVWAVIREISTWPELMGEFANIVPHGEPLVSGTRGAFAVKGLKAVAHLIAPGTFYVKQFFEGHSIGITFEQPHARLTILLEVEGDDLHCRLTHRVRLDGLASLIMKPIAQRLHANFWLTAARIGARVDVRPASEPLRVLLADKPGHQQEVTTRLAAGLLLAGHHPMLLCQAARPDLPFEQVHWSGSGLGPWVNELRAEPHRTALIDLSEIGADAATAVSAPGEESLRAGSLQCASPLRGWLQVVANSAEGAVDLEVRDLDADAFGVNAHRVIEIRVPPTHGAAERIQQPTALSRTLVAILTDQL